MALRRAVSLGVRIDKRERGEVVTGMFGRFPGYYNLIYPLRLNKKGVGIMGDGKPSREWSAFSKEIKLDEQDWAVVEGLFQNQRNTVGIISKADFVKQLVLAGASSQLIQLRQADPEALKRIATTSQSYNKKN